MQNRHSYKMSEYIITRCYYGWLRFWSWFKKNMRTICMSVLVILPLLVMVFGDGVASDGHTLYFGPMNFLFLMIELLACIGLLASGKIGTPEDLPVPRTRFTKTDGNETWIPDDRVQELVLYMQELEDWMYDHFYTDK